MQVNKSELLSVLSAVKPGIAKKDIVEQATHFIFTGSEIMAYNDTVCVIHPFETDFVCSVKAQDFYKVISTFNADTIQLSLIDSKLMIQGGTARSAFGVSEDLQDMLSMVDSLQLPSQEWVPLPVDFKQALFLCMFSASKDVSVAPFFCVHLGGDFIQSTDRFRLSRFKLSTPIKECLLPAYVIPDFMNYEFVEYALDSAWIHFVTKDDVVFSCRIIHGEFMDIQSVLDSVAGVSVVFPKDAKQAVDSVALLTVGDVDIERKIRVTIKDGMIDFYAEKDLGWFSHTMPIVDYSGEEISFWINPLFLSQILAKDRSMVIGDGKVFFGSGNFEHVIALHK